MKVEFTFKGGAVQVKRVISHDIFLTVIKPSKERLNELSAIGDKKLSKEQKEEISSLKNKLLDYQDEWCTDKSPLGLSIYTQELILPESQGGIHKVQTRILEE